MKIQLKVMVFESAKKSKTAKLVLTCGSTTKACTLTLYKSSTRTFALSTTERKNGVSCGTKYAKNTNGICWRGFTPKETDVVLIDEVVLEKDLPVTAETVVHHISDEILNEACPKIIEVKNTLYPPRKAMTPTQLADLPEGAKIVVSSKEATILRNFEDDPCMRVYSKEVDGKTLYRAKLGIRFANGVVAVTSAKIYENATTKGTRVPVQSNLYFSKVFFLATGLDVRDDTQKVRDFMKLLSSAGILSYNEKSLKFTLSASSISLYCITRKLGARDVVIIESVKVLTLINRIRNILEEKNENNK